MEIVQVEQQFAAPINFAVITKRRANQLARTAMKFDVIGRINNMRLPDGKTAILYSVYEAVSNSIHAINDRFKEEHATSRIVARHLTSMNL